MSSTVPLLRRIFFDELRYRTFFSTLTSWAFAADSERTAASRPQASTERLRSDILSSLQGCEADGLDLTAPVCGAGRRGVRGHRAADSPAVSLRAPERRIPDRGRRRRG